MSVVEKIKQIFSCEARSHVFPWTTDSIRILKQIEKDVLEILERYENTNMVLIEQLNEVIRDYEQKIQELADLLKTRPKPIDGRPTIDEGKYIDWFERFEKFVEKLAFRLREDLWKWKDS